MTNRKEQWKLTVALRLRRLSRGPIRPDVAAAQPGAVHPGDGGLGILKKKLNESQANSINHDTLLQPHDT